MPVAARRARVALQIGARTLLRRAGPDDEREFLASARASRELHRGLVEPPLTHLQFARLLRRAEHPATEVHLLCRREDGAICGVLNLNEIVRGAMQSASLGYYAFAPFAGHGYMTEGMQLVLRQAFRRLKLHRVEASVQPDNAASIALLVRAGFHEEGFSRRLLRVSGRWRDHLRFAVLAEEWTPRPAKPKAQSRRR